MYTYELYMYHVYIKYVNIQCICRMYTLYILTQMMSYVYSSTVADVIILQFAPPPQQSLQELCCLQVKLIIFN